MPSASLTIPEEALPDLKRIAELDDKLFNSLLSAIGESTPALTRDQFARKISERVKIPDEADLQAVLRAAFSLYMVKERAELSAREISEAVIDSALISQAEFPPDKKEMLRNRLTVLLDFDESLGISVKALDVMTEHERIFCGARILSDIRPVFSDHQLESASAATIIHNLQIEFHQDGRHHEHYFALDTDDIQTLKKVIERAEKKTTALQAILKKSNVPYLEV